MSARKTLFTTTRQPMTRRTLLRASGVALGLPMLDAMRPRRARASESETPRRLLAVCHNLGFIPRNFFPTGTGRDYTPSPYLEMVAKHRNDLTVFSGVSHPDVDGGHPADNCFLTCAPHPARGGFRNTISLDQHLAERIGHLTRVPSLNLGVNVHQGLRSLSWTSSGVLIPCEESPAAVYRRLFLQGSQAETHARVRKLKLGRSILDAVSNQARRLNSDLGTRDQGRMDQYFTSVRELEKRMHKSMQWEHKPKPTVSTPEPVDPTDKNQYFQKATMLYDMARLAFETDSTRIVALLLDSVNTPAVDMSELEVTQGYHNLSHHGSDPKKLAQLAAMDRKQMAMLDRLLTGLKEAQEDGAPLLDRTMVLHGSNMGDANKHVTTNMPILFAGGGFKHGQHLVFDKENNYPLPNLFVSILQRMGLQEERFAGTSTGTMRGLEMT